MNQPTISHIFAYGPYIECSDSASFFNSRTQGWRIKRARLINGAQEITLSEGRCCIKDVNKTTEKQFDSVITLTALNNTHLIDFVIGYAFKKNTFDVAHIGNHTFTHVNSKKRHQYPLTRCSLQSSHYSAHIEILGTNTCNNLFTPVMYVRDMNDLWIVHCRLLPKIIHTSVVQLHTPLYNKALPQFISSLVLKNAFLKKSLWYRSERNPYSLWNIPCKILNPSAVPLALLPQDASISLTTRVTIR